jgi:hypothetical protein
VWHFRFAFGFDVGVGFSAFAGTWFFCFRWQSALRLFAGIRDAPSSFKRRPCAGRHLLFFAAAKKSRQKKAAHTANP